jgi:hypothetical protein
LGPLETGHGQVICELNDLTITSSGVGVLITPRVSAAAVMWYRRTVSIARIFRRDGDVGKSKIHSSGPRSK